MRKVGLKGKIIFILIILLLLSLYPLSTTKSEEEKSKVLFFALENICGQGGEGLKEDIYKALSEALKGSDKFTLIEKREWEKFLKEKKLEKLVELSTLLDTSTLTDLGKLLDADKVIRGQITIYDEKFEKREAKLWLEVVFQVIDLDQAGRERDITTSSKVEIKGKKKGKEVKKGALLEVGESLIGQLAEEEIEQEVSLEECIGNTKSRLFHLPDCHHLPPPEQSIRFNSLEEAYRTGYRPCPICFPSLTPSTQSAGDLEMALGQEVSGMVEYYYRLLRDEELTSWVNRVGQGLVAVTPRRNLRFIFTVLDIDEMNALTAGAGLVYITKGMLDIIESDDELAGVLAHEIGHNVKEHVVRQYRQSTNLSLLGVIISGGMVNPAVDFAQILILNGFSRGFEREADRCALIYTLKADYDPRGFIRLLEKLQDLEKVRPSKLEVYFRSHPPTKDRIEHAKEFLKSWEELKRKMSNLEKEHQKTTEKEEQKENLLEKLREWDSH